MASLSRLFVDKIALTIPIRSRNSQQSVLDRLYECVEIGQLSLVSHGDLLSRYMFAFMMPLARDRFATLQVFPRDARQNYLRIEFNPRSKGKQGEHPFALIFEIFSAALPDFISLIERARINRLDFALDLVDVHIDRLAIHHNTRSAYSSVFGRDGKTTGIYIGKRTSTCYVVIYDKRKEEEMRSIYRRRERTRIEVRLSNAGALNKLESLNNPFELFSVTCYPQHAPSEYLYAHFLDSCRYRGAQAALELIESKRMRAHYRSWLSELCTPEWWNPNTIWGQRFEALRTAFDVGVR